MIITLIILKVIKNKKLVLFKVPKYKICRLLISFKKAILLLKGDNMKKILFFICLMFFGVGVKALEPTLYYQENIYSNRVGAENKIWSGKMAFIFMNNQIVYCLDPYLVVGNNYSVNSNYNISKSDLEYYSIVAYYGYNSTNRSSIYYYMAAQELIWEHMIGKGNVFWTTGQYNAGDRIDISRYKREIENDINAFYLEPTLNNIYYLNSFKTLNLNDSNNVLSKYSMTNNSNSYILKNDNNLSIFMNDKEKAEVSLKRKISNNIPTIFYQSSGSQTLGQFGTNIEKEKKITFYLGQYETRVYLNFYDKNTNQKIEDLSFSFCDLDIMPEKSEEGYIIDNMKEGTYTLCDISEPYRKDDLSFKIDKDDFSETTYINFYLLPNKKELSPVEPLLDEKILDDKNLEKLPMIEDSSKTILPNYPELPNTYDYETPIYTIILLILMGSVIYKVK